MNISLKSLSLSIVLTAVALFGATSCEDGQSYADLLNQESKYVNNFLVDQTVVGGVPADSVFEYGENAPYYQLDDEGNIFMKVIDPGNGPKATDGQRIYFRFMRYNLAYYVSGETMTGEGNESDMSQVSTYFDYNSYSLPSSTQYGSGLQMPLHFLPINCEVYLVVKSQYGFSAETSYVQPYLYHIRYYKSQI